MTTTKDERSTLTNAKATKAPYKRMIFAFDGTWNKLTTATPTNVVLTAASIKRLNTDGITQIIHYDEGVGTTKRERLTGGIFGAGLDVNLREAYRFLIFNYDPGDQIYIFGFSRGAFTARSFVGLLRHIGPLRRLHVDRIDEAISLYKKRLSNTKKAQKQLLSFKAHYADGVCTTAEDDEYRCANTPGYVAGNAPKMSIRFLGLWDTVGAMGVPRGFPLSKWINRKHHYHDTKVDDFVESMRHALAIDERRRLFPATLAEGITNLNIERGFDAGDPKAAYQELWFPGTHGSVGGGGDIRGLSDAALAWVLDGAQIADLKLDTEHGTRIHRFMPNYRALLFNDGKVKRGLPLLMSDRPGPISLHQVHRSAQKRWQTGTGNDGLAYRPKTLNLVAAELDQLPPDDFVIPTDIMSIEMVKANDTLSKIAKRVWGKASLYRLIFEANRDTIDDADNIFAGQALRIPRRPSEPIKQGNQT